MKYLDLVDSLAPSWHAKAACNHTLSRDLWPEGHHPDTWYPTTPAGRPDERPTRRAVAAPAVETCKRCPVREQCLAAAKENGETHGIWGGVDFDKPNTREPINRCGTNAGYMVHLRKKEDACEECKKAHADKKKRAA